MKKISLSSFLAIIGAFLIITTALALISNGNFETGDFTGWTKTTGINVGFNSPLSPGGADLSAVVGGPAVTPLSLSDPNSGNNILFPAYGHYSARINSEDSYSGGSLGDLGQNANMITQDFTAVLSGVDNQAHVRFVYSAVMVNPVDNPHTDEQKPYFRVRAINTSNGNDVLYDFSSYVGEPGKNWQNGPSFGGGSDFWQYLDWVYVDLASSAAHPVQAGDIIRLEISAAGCSLGGHPGYVYVDEITDGDITGPNIKAVGPATAQAGSTITYTYTYNNGSGVSVDPTIVINPPANVTFTTLGDPVNCSGFAPVTCTFTGVPAGGSGSFTVTGDIAPAAAGTTIAHGDYSISATGFPTVGGPTVLTVVPANSAPVAVDDTYSTHMSVVLNGTTVFANDSDADNDTLTGIKVTDPAHASAFSFNPTTGQFSYTPENGFQGVDSFTYMVNDGSVNSNIATVTINVTPLRAVLKSLALYDGWVKESSETSDTGLRINGVHKNLPVGDDGNDKQWRSILHFNTGSLPDNAVILSAALRVKNTAILGVNPFTTHGNMVADMRRGYFGTSPQMQSMDFQAPASVNSIGNFAPIAKPGWYQITLDAGYYQYLSLTGPVQFRLRFVLDDDDDRVQDYFRVYSGNAAKKANHPQLIIQYYVPLP